MRIPNMLSLAMIIGYIFYMLYMKHELYDVIIHVSCALSILILSYLLFVFRIIGGGDGKFIAVIALWYGWSQPFLEYTVLAGLLGGLLCLCALTVRNIAFYLPIPVWIPDWLTKRDHKVPYGVALGIAGLLTIQDIIN